MFVDFTGAGRDALDAAIMRAQPHLVPPFVAVRDHGCAFAMVAQSRNAFAVPEGKPAIVIIGDDLARALGPPGFHVRSLRRFLPRCGLVAIMSGAPVTSAYAKATLAAVTRRLNVAIIETRLEYESEWAAFAAEVAPDAETHLASPTVAQWGARG